MSYLDQTNRNRPRTIAAVAILHAGLGYLIVSGLAYTVIKYVDPVTPTNIYKDPPPPSPHDMPPPPRDTPRADPRPTAVDTLVKADIPDATEVVVVPADIPKPRIDIVPLPQPTGDLPEANLARPAEAGSGRASWVTTEDYPPQPLREEVSGTVGISVAIGADGHVQACEVTKSSGNAELDNATCRIYTRRAHFKPALDAEGKPTATRFVDRIRWQLPVQ